MHAPTPTRTPTKKSRRAFWLKQLHMWHWMSSAISLIGLLLFTVTGFTLNHAAEIEGTPVVTEGIGQLPAPLLAQIAPDDGAQDANMDRRLRAGRHCRHQRRLRGDGRL